MYNQEGIYDPPWGGDCSVLLMLCFQSLEQGMASSRCAAKADSVSLLRGGESRLLKRAGVIHSHHPYPKIEASVNSLGGRVVANCSYLWESDRGGSTPTLFLVSNREDDLLISLVTVLDIEPHFPVDRI